MIAEMGNSADKKMDSYFDYPFGNSADIGTLFLLLIAPAESHRAVYPSVFASISLNGIAPSRCFSQVIVMV